MDTLEIYKKIYKLPVFSRQENISFDFFNSCREEHKFIVICIFNKKGEIFLLRDFNKNIGWELAGGYIQNNEKMEDAVNRIVLDETSLAVNELEPIFLLKNTFSYKKKNKVHSGIAFLAFSDGEIKNDCDNVQKVFTREMPLKMAYQNKKIFKDALEIIKNKVSDFPYKEIESINKYFINHIFHKLTIQKIGKSASRKIKRKIEEQVSDNPKTILDVSCGDDSLIFRLEKKFPNSVCIANDVSWKTISLIRSKHLNSEVIFTNHDVHKLPFKDKIDLVIFKNTLHHISYNKQDEVIQELSKLSKQLIICDIDNPLKSGFWAKAWNWYYVNILGDVGNSFLSFRAFKQEITKNVKNKIVSFGKIKTIKGDYYYANVKDTLNNEEKKIEVEIKIKIKKDQVKEIKKKLEKNNFISSEIKNEEDIYYTSVHNDFIKTKECLRIRRKDDFAEMTYKGKTNDNMIEQCQFWKKEFNVSLGKKQVNNAKQFLGALGFIEVVEVVKKRQEFKLFQSSVVIDKVRDAGLFIEIETMISTEKERKNAIATNLKILKFLGLENCKLVNEPYRDIVLASKNN